MILSMCSHCYTRGGSSKLINQQIRRSLEETIKGMVAHPRQYCIAFALKYIEKEHAVETSGLTLLAMVGLKESSMRMRMKVDACRVAGVYVKMISMEVFPWTRGYIHGMRDTIS